MKGSHGERLVELRQDGKRRRWSVAERRVWPPAVVVSAPVFDDRLGLFQAVKNLAVQALVSELAVEGLEREAISGDLERLVGAERNQPFRREANGHQDDAMFTAMLADEGFDRDGGIGVENVNVEPGRPTGIRRAITPVERALWYIVSHSRISSFLVSSFSVQFSMGGNLPIA